MSLSEQWRALPGAESYEVSSLGRVRRNGRVLNPHVNMYGYATVTVFGTDGSQKTRRVHQLVLEAFVGPRPKGMVVAHGDGDKLNNALPNLRYCTSKENRADDLAHGVRRWGERHHEGKLTAVDVANIRASSGVTQRALAAKYGVSQSMICRVLSGKYWPAEHIQSEKADA